MFLIRRSQSKHRRQKQTCISIILSRQTWFSLKYEVRQSSDRVGTSHMSQSQFQELSQRDTSSVESLLTLLPGITGVVL
jgi:hypothetical protein